MVHSYAIYTSNVAITDKHFALLFHLIHNENLRYNYDKFSIKKSFNFILVAITYYSITTFNNYSTMFDFQIVAYFIADKIIATYRTAL